MIPGVCIFGFGGVLFDTEIAYGKGLERAFGSVGDVYNPSDFHDFSNLTLQGLFGLRYKEHPCKYREFVAEFLRGFEEGFSDSAPFPETSETIGKLYDKGTVMGIVTESYEEPVRSLLKEQGIEDCFKSIVGLERSFLRRPDPYSLNQCVRELNADSGDTVYLGWKNAALGAADGAGIRKIKLDRSGRGHSDGTIKDLSELLI